jgi:uncharacterized protein (DUF433 family)
VALSDLDENYFDKCLCHKQRSVPLDNDTIPSAKVSTYFSGGGEKIVKEITRHQRRLSDAEMGQIIIAYQNGKTTYELATEYGCHRNTISQNLKKHGIHVFKDKAQMKINATKVIEMYSAKHTIDQIAECFDVSAHTIRQCLCRNGVGMRTRWGYI